jgi:hypothetical protein
MHAAPYTKQEAELLATQINKLTGKPLYRGMDMLIDRAFAFPYNAHPPLIELFKSFSETGRTLTDILASRQEQYTQFNVAIIYHEQGDDEDEMMQNADMFLEQLRDRL